MVLLAHTILIKYSTFAPFCTLKIWYYLIRRPYLKEYFQWNKGNMEHLNRTVEINMSTKKIWTCLACCSKGHSSWSRWTLDYINRYSCSLQISWIQRLHPNFMWKMWVEFLLKYKKLLIQLQQYFLLKILALIISVCKAFKFAFI